MRKRNIFYILFFLGFIFLIFRNWFLFPQIIGGDWPYFFDEMLKNYSFFFSSWNPFQGNGFGGISPFYSLGVFHGFTVFLSQTFHIPWSFTYKFSWFGLFIGLSIFSSMYLLKTVLPRVKFWQQIFAAMIFSANTYILMVVSGGQMGVALAYSVAPLVLARFVKAIHNSEFIIHHSVLAGLVLAIQVMFDPRIAYITMIAVVGYYFINKFQISNFKFQIVSILNTFVIPGFVAVLLHAVWIIPLMVTRINPISVLGDAYTGAGIVKFLSFASFSHSLSLLHPNWPENIFGKVGFMKPEFILIPILAFSSLLFLINSAIKQFNPEKIASQFNGAGNRTILFFALLGIVGAFLAKGASEPFGAINLWMFEYIPGMNMFRDPTKFYLLTALAYSVLIPFSIYHIYNWLILNFQPSLRLRPASKIQNFLPNLFLLFTICYLLFLIRPAIFGQLGGTFKKHEVPKEYIELKDFLYNQKEYFRTLWIPRQQRFSFVSDIHPAIEAEPLFGTRSAEILSKKISSDQGQLLLSELSVKYVLIQYDSLGEQFLDDRKYSEKQRMEYERKLDATPWLKKIRTGKITVYETSFKKDHFFLDKMGKISVITISPMHYVLTVSIDQPQKLIFSESFHPKWQLVLNDKIIHSQKTAKGLNSFLLSKGNYHVEVIFSGDKYYTYGKVISLGTVAVIVVFLFVMHKKKVYNT